MRYFLGFLVAIGLIILVIVLLFRGPSEPEVPTTSKTLASYATTNAEAILTVDGPVNAQSQHKALRITVDRNNVTYEEVAGYQGNVTRQERFDNNTEAFEVFLKSLNRAGFTQGNTDAALADVEGRCPLGSRYIFELKQDDRSVSRFWATSCDSAQSYQGDVRGTRKLFEAQVPNYDDLTREARRGFNFSL